MDDGVRERAGVKGFNEGFVSIYEEGPSIVIAVSDGQGLRKTTMAPVAARRLARQLNHLAKRTEGRANE